MDAQLHLGLRGLAHAEAGRVGRAMERLGEVLTAQGLGIHALALQLPMADLQAEWLASLPAAERDATLGRGLARAVLAATSGVLSTMVREVSTALTAEADRLAPFADTVDLLLNTPTSPPGGSLRTRLATVRGSYHQLVDPGSDLAWAEHAALRQNLALQIGLPAVAQRLLTGAGGEANERLRSAATAGFPDAATLQEQLTELTQRLALRMIDAVDVHLDTAWTQP